MASRRKRGPKHPGVVLMKPDVKRRIGWRARFVDPDTEKETKVTLDVALTTVELREDWAVRKSKALARRRLELEGGAHRATGTGLDTAIDSYFDDHPQLRDGTRKIYRRATNKLSAWARGAGVRLADDLTGPKLVAFRALLVREPRGASAKGGKRGARRETKEPRSAHSVNRELRSVQTVLTYLRRLGLLPRISTDDLKDGLQKLSAPVERLDYLKPHDLQKLLESALRHDAAVFTETREEHAGLRPLGSTLRYGAIAPMIVAAIMTGMRFGELVDLDWKKVDLDALDNTGHVAGEIHLEATTKTNRARDVGLEVSPALRTMLAAMHLRAGGKGSVFKLTRDTAKASSKRLVREFGAPAGFSWQALRRTCGTFLTNSPGIFGAASAYRSAKQLGHSVEVAEKHYVGVVRGIPLTATTLEAAMQIETQAKLVIEAASSATARTRKVG